MDFYKDRLRKVFFWRICFSKTKNNFISFCPQITKSKKSNCSVSIQEEMLVGPKKETDELEKESDDPSASEISNIVVEPSPVPSAEVQGKYHCLFFFIVFNSYICKNS